MATEILPRLFLGSLDDAYHWSTENGGSEQVSICVLEYSPKQGLPKDTISLPLLQPCVSAASNTPPRTTIGRLEKIARAIHFHWTIPSRRVLVFCAAGVERAPLALAWYLTSYYKMTLDEAYALVRSKRPFVEDRSRWLPETT